MPATRTKERLHQAPNNRLQTLGELAQVLPQYKSEIEPWLLMEIGLKSKGWIEELESALCNGHNAAILLRVLPPLYEVLDVPDRGSRAQRLQQRAIQLLIKDGEYAALAELRTQPERQPKLEAVCLEGIGDLRGAAQRCNVAAGKLKEALRCYRTIPDLDEALTAR